MKDQLGASLQSPEYARDILLPIKKIENKSCDLGENIHLERDYYIDEIENINTLLAKFVYYTKSTLSSCEGTVLEETELLSLRKSPIKNKLDNIYLDSGLNDIKKKLSELRDSDESSVEVKIKLMDNDYVLRDIVCVIEYATKKLNKTVLSDLSKAYSKIEEISLDRKYDILEELGACINSIATVCENNQETLLRLRQMGPKILNPTIIGNINEKYRILTDR